MSEIVIDTSVWIDFFRGVEVLHIEEALSEGRVFLTPLVVSELMSGVKTKSEEKKMEKFVLNTPLVDCDLSHWLRVGNLRSFLIKKGFNVSTPDAHVAQCALDKKAYLYSFDKIFNKIAACLEIKLLSNIH